ncbi:hypothetical protein AVEN_161435-1 [Araneus ventricosus]|uniref:Uncharacterized protein n=1 Tax=Araneus ventricosus TaxID=182803 RepID=A0A4Y2M462_ARAVE|nr:hypothetical protein AVEN_161435-1 [Araneus ventricosus]
MVSEAVCVEMLSRTRRSNLVGEVVHKKLSYVNLAAMVSETFSADNLWKVKWQPFHNLLYYLGPVTVSAHSTLNSPKRVISCGDLFHTQTEETNEDLKSQVHSIKTWREGKLLDTKHLVLTFHHPKLP